MRKFKKAKVFISMVAAISLLCMSSTVFAASPTNQAVERPISLSTKVTNNNIYQVLANLGIDTSKVVVKSGSNTSKTYTVQDLENEIQEAKTQANKNKTLISSSNSSTDLTSTPAFPPIGEELLTDIDSYTYYNITYSVYGLYYNYQWTDAINPSVSIQPKSGSLLSYSIDFSSLNVAFTPSEITLNSVVTVGDYLTIGVGSASYTFETGSDTYTSSNPFPASVYL